MEVMGLSLDKITVVGKMKEIRKKREGKLAEELKQTIREIEELEKDFFIEVTSEEVEIERFWEGDQETLFGGSEPVWRVEENRVEKKEMVKKKGKENEKVKDRLKRLRDRKIEVEMKMARSEVASSKVDEMKELDSRVLQMLRGERNGFGEKIGLLEQLMGEGFWLYVREQPDYTSPIYNWRFKLGDHAFCQVNTGVDRVGNNFRIEWNPNKVKDWEVIYIYELLMYVESKRFTKTDLAIDVKEDLSKWEIIDEKERKKRRFESGKGVLETLDLGTKYSDAQVTIYNKTKERKDQDGEEIKGVWWRIEEKVRGDSIVEWEKHQWFEGVRFVKRLTGYKEIDEIDFPKDMKANEMAQIIACLVKPELIERYAKGTRAKIREKIKGLARVEKIETEFIPKDYIKEKMSTDLTEIKRTLKKIINL